MPHHQQSTRRGYIAIAVALLVLLALLPARWGGWVERLGDTLRMLTAPVTYPIYRAVRLVTPEPGAPSEQLALLKNEIEKWKTLYLKALAEKEDAERKFETLSKGALYVEPQAQLLRQVIGAGAEPFGQITVRAGKRDGVEMNTVATTVGVQLVGRVVRVSSRQCDIRLINEVSSSNVKIKGVVMLSDSARGPICLLSAVTDGKLQGVVGTDFGERAPAVGQIVRLIDDKWPRSAQMLVIGSIQRVETDSTGHHIITVAPTVDLERLAEVVLRISPQEPDDKPAARSPSSTDGGHP